MDVALIWSMTRSVAMRSIKRSARLAWGGRLLVVGFASGRIPTLAVNRALIKGISVIGVRAGEHVRQRPEAWAANSPGDR